MKQIELSEVDGAIIMMQENIKYYSRFTGEEGIIMVHSFVQYLIVKDEYVEQAKHQSPNYKIVNANNKDALGFLNIVFKELGIHTIWFEEDYIKPWEYESLKNNLEQVKLIPKDGNTLI
ncbi:aminopeptidase P family N-terminal domain-containing protein [Xylanivirga thermophila]|uniref:aminopeptidase P family N-terminal domain-containing protein n=1 Tax=Xylanivirga thermophila TaxID=2496273 RepID=UPI002436CF65|nr:aminopeptidase P family N-terminal domain-containing protein [Xylanivirga thermophila]